MNKNCRVEQHTCILTPVIFSNSVLCSSWQTNLTSSLRYHVVYVIHPFRSLFFTLALGLSFALSWPDSLSFFLFLGSLSLSSPLFYLGCYRRRLSLSLCLMESVTRLFLLHRFIMCQCTIVYLMPSLPFSVFLSVFLSFALPHPVSTLSVSLSLSLGLTLSLSFPLFGLSLSIIPQPPSLSVPKVVSCVFVQWKTLQDYFFSVARPHKV